MQPVLKGKSKEYAYGLLHLHIKKKWIIIIIIIIM
jgi:hypothetical protein